MNGYFEEINGNKYLTLFPTNQSKEKTKSKTKNSEDCNKKYIKIKFNSDDKLPLNKWIKIPTMTIFARAVFHENNK